MAGYPGGGRLCRWRLHVAAPPLAVTIDIGAGDFLQLGADAGLAQIRQSPQVILAALRDAAGGTNVPATVALRQAARRAIIGARLIARSSRRGVRE
jgi:hypothetical protein